MKEICLPHSRDGSISTLPHTIAQLSGYKLIHNLFILFKSGDFSGAAPNQPCVFPFKFFDVIAYGCLSPSFTGTTNTKLREVA